MEQLDGVDVIAFADAAAWEAWLAANHGRQAGVWLKMARKRSGIASVTEDEVVDLGLCYGWVSGQRRPLDERYYLQKYVPRRPRSLWSKVNVQRVERLRAEGRMREPGLAEVRAAQADGRWARAYEPQKTATVPADVRAALDASAAARRSFEALDRSSQYRLYLPVLQARTERSRQARLTRMIAALEAGRSA
jgi:uncharacterized protein YdeI (YjbR/CyaY-like superfamily)